MTERFLYPQSQLLSRERMNVQFAPGFTKERVLDSLKFSIQQALRAQGITDPSNLPDAAPVPRKQARGVTQPAGDFGVPLHAFARQLDSQPQVIAQAISDTVSAQIDSDESFFRATSAVNGYVNFELNMPRYAEAVLRDVEAYGSSYGAENIGNGKVVVDDTFSPNVGKPAHFGHLRSAVIGMAIRNILEFTGHTVITDNHIGDWGAQFGMLLKAIDLWGDEYSQLKIPGQEVNGLLELYQRIHRESEAEKSLLKKQILEEYKTNRTINLRSIETAATKLMQQKKLSPEAAVLEAIDSYSPETSLDRAGRDWFIRLEQGDHQAVTEWQQITELSMRDFQEISDRLGIEFDLVLGESAYGPMMSSVAQELAKRSDFVWEEDGALTAHLPELEDEGLDRVVIRARDGRSLYITRDIATALYRQEVLGAQEQIYVVGSDQGPYFKQLFLILQKMGVPLGENSIHLGFGLVTTTQGKLSTRSGNIVLLKDVMDRMEENAYEMTEDRIEDPKKRMKIARQVSMGALIWSDLHQGITRGIEFDWDEVLSLKENTGPYVQYTNARAAGIIRLAQEIGLTTELSVTEVQIINDVEADIIKLLGDFPGVVKIAAKKYDPSNIAEYLIRLSRKFNEMYAEVRIIDSSTGSPTADPTRLRITAAVSQVIKNGLHLMGIEAPDEM